MRQGDLVRFNPHGTEDYPVADKIEISSRHPNEVPNFTIGWIEDGEICIYLERTVFRGFSHDTNWIKVAARAGVGWVRARWFEAISEEGTKGNPEFTSV